MKRSLICFFLLLVLAAGGSAAVFSQVYAARDQVELRAETVFGDPACAEGLAVTVPVSYAGQAFWETTCFLGRETRAETSYRFFQTAQPDESEPQTPALDLGTEISFGYDSDAESGIALAYGELFEETGPGSERERVVRLADYYEYYPLTLYVTLPDRSEAYSEESYVRGLYKGAPERLFSAFRDFFRVRVLESETIRISVSKDAQGRLAGVGSASTDSDSYGLWSVSAVRGNECYFAFNAVTQQGGTVDVSGVAGGFGVYRAVFCEEEGELALSSLETVYPLDPETAILNLTLSPDESRLLLHTGEDGDYVITELDLGTFEPVRRTAAPGVVPEGGGASLFEEEGFLVAVTDHLTVFTLAPGGDCALALSVPFDYENEPVFTPLLNSTSFVFDGSRLAVFDTLPDAAPRGPNFYAAVYDASGLLYYGTYRSSLSLGSAEGTTGDMRRSARLRPREGRRNRE